MSEGGLAYGQRATLEPLEPRLLLSVSVLNAAASSGDNATTETVSSFNVPAGDDLALIVLGSGYGLLNSVNSFGGQSFSFVGAEGDALAGGSGSLDTSVWIALLGDRGTATAANVVSNWTVDGDNTTKRIVALALSGVDQTSPTSGFVSDETIAGSHFLDVTSQIGDLVVDAIATGFDGGGTVATLTAGAGQTDLVSDGVIDLTEFGGIQLGASYEPGQSTTQMSWSDFGSATDLVHVAVNIVQSIPPADTEITLSGGVLTITDVGAASDDDLTLSYSGGTYTLTDTGGLTFDVSGIAGATGDGTSTVTFPDTGITSIGFEALDGDDTLTVDFSDGDPTPTDGITFNGGAQNTADTLVITGNPGGTPFGTVTSNYTNANDGSVDLDGSVITYTGLEPVDMTGSTATDFVFNLPAGADNTELSDIGGGNFRLRSTDAVPTFETTDFVPPSGSITINGGAGDDSITVAALTYAGDLSIDGEGDADTVGNSGAIGVGSLTATAETIGLSANVTTPGGAIALNGTTVLNADVALDTTDGGATPAGADIGFNGDLTGTPDDDITLDAGTAGNIAFGGMVMPSSRTFQESGGVIVAEAERFTARTSMVGEVEWVVRPTENAGTTEQDGGPIITNARGGAYVQILPDQDATGGGGPLDLPEVLYRFDVTTAGTYRLYLRWDGNNTSGGSRGASDSIFADIVELKDGVGGTIADWYEFAQGINGNFASPAWDAQGGFEVNNAGGTPKGPAAWDLTPGTYTMRFTVREDGAAVDAFVLQLDSLGAPTGVGPAESAIDANNFGHVLIHNANDVDVSGTMTVASFTQTTGQGTTTIDGATEAVAGDVSVTTDVIIVNAPIDTAGAGAIDLEALRNIVVSGDVTTVNGDLSLTANMAGTATGSFDGVALNGGAVMSTNGTITLNGTSGDANGDTGVRIFSGGSVVTTGTGAIDIDGQAAVNGVGVTMQSPASVTSVNGDISITGTGAGPAGASNRYGVLLDGATVESTGAGSISVTGVGADGRDNNHGVYLDNAAEIANASGTVMVHGTSGGSRSANRGVLVTGASEIGGGAGAVSITGFGGTGSGSNNWGVGIQSGSLVQSTGGGVSVMGTGGSDGSTSSGTNIGLRLDGGSVIEDTGSGAVGITGTGGDGRSDNVGVIVRDTDTRISTVSGDLSVTGFGGASAVNGHNDNHGVNVLLSSLITSEFGSIGIEGTGATAARGIGVRINSDVTSTGTGANASTITITGTGTGAAGTGNSGAGVVISGVDASVTSIDGDILIEGDSADRDGVVMGTGPEVVSTGTGVNAATITITGTTMGTNRNGVAINSGSLVTSVDGDIRVVGSAPLSNQPAVDIVLNAQINSTGTGAEAATIDIESPDTAILVLDAQVTTVDGDIVFDSAGGVEGDESALVEATGVAVISVLAGEFDLERLSTFRTNTGALEFVTDLFDSEAGSTIEGSGDLIIRPRTTGRSIGLGGGAGDLQIDDASIGTFADGFNSITIGETATPIAMRGDVVIDTVTFTDPVTIAGNAINDGDGTFFLETLDVLSTGDYTVTSDEVTYSAHVDHDGTNGWLLVGRGREGWRFDTSSFAGQDQVSQNLGTPAAFSSRNYDAAFINDLILNAGVDMADVEVRLRRAADPTGTDYQELRWRDFTGNNDIWTWDFDDSQYGITMERVNAPAGLAGASIGTNTAGNTRDFEPAGNDADRVFTWPWAPHDSEAGFSYGSSVANGSNDPNSFLWEFTNENHAIPYTEVYVRILTPAAPTVDIDAGTNTVTLDGNVAPGLSPGVEEVIGDYVFADGSAYALEIGGNTPGDTATNHDQVSVTGGVTIGANVTLNASTFNAYVPQAGDVYVIIDNDGADAVAGEFAGLAEGTRIANFAGSGLFAEITYSGGDGNDVVLTVQNTDFGDAPDSYGTLLASGGAAHGNEGPTLGAARDADADGQPSANADGDDALNIDDEDGVTFLDILTPGLQDATLEVTVAGGPALLDAWIDFNGNGVFDAATERIFDGEMVDGTSLVRFDIPADALPGDTYARFRLSTAGVAAPTGFALDGEVEDYRLTIADPSGVGAFADTGQELGGEFGSDVALADLDGDGDVDAFVANTIGQSNTVWLNDGTGAFDPIVQNIGSFFSDAVALGDLDGDGDLDAVTANDTDDLSRVWFNDGAGNFSAAQALDDRFSSDVALGDLDGDGDLDAFITNRDGQADRVWLNDGAGALVDSGQLLGATASEGVELADLDGDRDLDAFVVNPAGAANVVWLNDGTGTFTDSGQAIGNRDSRGLALGDVDNDGDIDAFVANRLQGDRVWLNDGAGVFAHSGQSLGNLGSIDVALGDVDGDGDLDAFVPNLDGVANRVWLNDGAGLFTSNTQLLGAASSRGAALGDVDGDGDLDAFVTNFGEPDRVWFNQPVGRPDTYTLDEDTLRNGASVLNNDFANGVPMTAAVDTAPTHGALAFNADGTFTYVPEANFNGTDTFTYRVQAGGDASFPVTVTLIVSPVNDAPVAMDNAYMTVEDTPLVVAASGVLMNDDDPVEGDILTATLVGDVDHGTLALGGDGAFTYTPDLDFVGTDTFTYLADDGNGGWDVATVTITVVAASDGTPTPPVAGDDAYGLNEDGFLFGASIFANDAPANVGDGPLVGAIIAGPGDALFFSFNPSTGTFFYRPAADFVGTDSFTYTVDDQNGTTSNTATVAITVNAVNDRPIGVQDEYDTAIDTPLNVAPAGVIDNDPDPDGGFATTAQLVLGPTHAAAFVLRADGSFDYTPAAGFTGVDQFWYRPGDGVTTGLTTRVLINVTNELRLVEEVIESVSVAEVVIDDAETPRESEPTDTPASRGDVLFDLLSFTRETRSPFGGLSTAAPRLAERFTGETDVDRGIRRTGAFDLLANLRGENLL